MLTAKAEEIRSNMEELKKQRDVEKKGAVTQQDSRGNQGNKHQFTKIK